jgi:hypothetical protein
LKRFGKLKTQEKKRVEQINSNTLKSIDLRHDRLVRLNKDCTVPGSQVMAHNFRSAGVIGQTYEKVQTSANKSREKGERGERVRVRVSE